MDYIKSKKLTILIIFTIASLFIAFNYLKLSGKPYVEDESLHYPTVQKILNEGIFSKQAVSMIPGYHACIAFFLKVFNLQSLSASRVFSLILNLLTITIFFIAALKITKDKVISSIKTFQLLALPILFPFISLVYTDIFSLFFILLSLYFCLSRNLFIAGIIASLGLLVRQTNIVWLLMIPFFSYIHIYGNTLSITNIKKHIVASTSFILGSIAFLVFVILNDGIALGSFTEFHKETSIYTGNIFFLLSTFTAIFFPLVIFKIKEIIHPFQNNKVSILFILIAFLLYMTTFSVTHVWNINEPWYLRNKVLDIFAFTMIGKVLFFIPIILAVLTLIKTKLYSKEMMLIYPFSIISLLPFSLIDPRYYFPQLMLLLLFRKPEKSKKEIIITIYFAILATLLMLGQLNHKFTI